MLPAVLNVNNFHYVRGGSDSYFFELSRLLKERGHRIGTFSSESELDVENDLKVAGCPSGVDTSRAAGLGNVRRFLYSSDAARKMEQAVSKFRPDVAHLHIYYGQLTASILAPIHRQGIPLVQTLHEYKLVCATHGLYANGQYCDRCQGHAHWKALLEKCNRGSLSRTALSVAEAYLANALGDRRLVDRYIAVSEYQKRTLLRLGLPGEKLRVVHHFADAAEKPADGPGSYFLYVGRMVREKGIVELLHAYAQLDKPRPPLVLVGGGSDAELIGREIAALKLTGEVVLAGHKNKAELAELYRQCICAINPSRLNETFGLTVLEAMSYGRPVIASNVGALPEMVRHMDTGILVESRAESELARAMELLWRQPAEAMRMGLAAWQMVRDEFSKDAHYRKISSVYREVL